MNKLDFCDKDNKIVIWAMFIVANAAIAILECLIWIDNK